MHQASRSSFSLPGQLQPESVHALLCNLGDALRPVVISEVLAGRWRLIAVECSALASDLRDVSERIASASRQCVYSVLIIAIGNDAEGR